MSAAAGAHVEFVPSQQAHRAECYWKFDIGLAPGTLRCLAVIVSERSLSLLACAAAAPERLEPLWNVATFAVCGKPCRSPQEPAQHDLRLGDVYARAVALRCASRLGSAS